MSKTNITKPFDEALIVIDTSDPALPIIYVNRMNRLTVECGPLLADPEFQQKLIDMNMSSEDSVFCALHLNNKDPKKVGFFIGKVDGPGKEIYYSYVSASVSIYIFCILEQHIKTSPKQFKIRIFDTIDDEHVFAGIQNHLENKKHDDRGMIVCFKQGEPICTLATTNDVTAEFRPYETTINIETNWVYQLYKKGPMPTQII